MIHTVCFFYQNKNYLKIRHVSFSQTLEFSIETPYFLFLRRSLLYIEHHHQNDEKKSFFSAKGVGIRVAIWANLALLIFFSRNQINLPFCQFSLKIFILLRSVFVRISSIFISLWHHLATLVKILNVPLFWCRDSEEERGWGNISGRM